MICAGGVCVPPAAFYHEAVSPNLQVDGYSQFRVVDESLPAWTEPNWGPPWGSLPALHVYQVDSERGGWLTFVIGMMVVAGTWFGSNKVLVGFLDANGY